MVCRFQRENCFCRLVDARQNASAPGLAEADSALRRCHDLAGFDVNVRVCGRLSVDSRAHKPYPSRFTMQAVL